MTDVFDMTPETRLRTYAHGPGRAGRGGDQGSLIVSGV